MPSGITYDLKTPAVEKELWNQATTYRLEGGFNLDDSNLVVGSFIPILCPMQVDFSTRKVLAVKNVKVVSTTGANDTTIKIAKDSLAYVGILLGTGAKGAKVTNINKSEDEYDTLTLENAFGVVLKENQVLFEASAEGGTTPKHTAHFMNYARTKVETGATITLIGQAFEIKESELYAPVSSKNKETLSARFMFV